ncbi:MAG: DUF1588 domain-containing protein [Akkermansiaceae bacterium]
MPPFKINSVCLWLIVLPSFLGTALADEKEPIQSFLESHCIKCHGVEKKKGKLSLHDVGFDFRDSKTAEIWIEVLDQLTAEDMPPEDEEQPEAAEREEIIDWINEELQKVDQGDAYRKKLLAPEYGNWVSHEKLFSGEIDTPPYSPSRLWRYSPEVFDKQGFGKARSPYTYITPDKAIRDYSAMSSVDQSTVQMVLINAEQFFEERETKGEFKEFADDKPTPNEEVLELTVVNEFRRIVGRVPTTDDKEKYLVFLKESIETGGNMDGLKTMVKAIFLKPEAIYRMEFGLGGVDKHGRRHLSPEEIVQALAYALTDVSPDKNKTLWKAYQDDSLNTKADVAKIVRELLEEDPGNWSRPTRPRIMRFFEQYFGFDKAGDVFKDNDRKRKEAIPQWNTQLLIHDVQQLINQVLREDKDVIAELLTTNKYFVAHPGDNDYAREFYEERFAEVTSPSFVESEVAIKKKQLEGKRTRVKFTQEYWDKQVAKARKDAEKKVANYLLAKEQGIKRHPEFPFTNKSRGIADLIYIAPYNLPESGRANAQKWDWPVEQPFELPADQRAGILTHPAWLAAFSFNDGNDPIHRGIWVREKLLAGKLNDVPPDVDAKVPIDPHKTLRERMDILRAERCWNCHHKINPLGETFEMFDDWGRFRTDVYFDEEGKIFHERGKRFEQLLEQGKLEAHPINATGAISGSGDPTVDGEVENAIEMLHRIGKSDIARQSFIRHLFRYFMGRNEMLSDSRTLVEAEKAYLDHGGSFKELVVSLLSSDSFLYRR